MPKKHNCLKDFLILEIYDDNALVSVGPDEVALQNIPLPKKGLITTKVRCENKTCRHVFLQDIDVKILEEIAGEDEEED